jgi:metallophosphoesterase superfamily enzyme
VVQRRRELCLGAEAAQEAGIVGERGVQHLHRDATTETDVVGHVHPATGARSDRTEQAVAPGEHASDEVGDCASGHSHEGTGRIVPVRGTPSGRLGA